VGNFVSYQWRSQKILIGEADFTIVSDCSIRVTALLGYLDLVGPVFWNLENTRSSLEMPELLLMCWVALLSVLYIQQVRLAFQLNIPEIFSEALASPAYMVATPMIKPLQLNYLFLGSNQLVKFEILVFISKDRVFNHVSHKMAFVNCWPSVLVKC